MMYLQQLVKTSHARHEKGRIVKEYGLHSRDFIEMPIFKENACHFPLLLKAQLQPTGIACRETIFIYENSARR